MLCTHFHYISFESLSICDRLIEMEKKLVYLLFQILIQTSKKFVWISTTTKQVDSTPKLRAIDKYPELKVIHLWMQAWWSQQYYTNWEDFLYSGLQAAIWPWILKYWRLICAIYCKDVHWQEVALFFRRFDWYIYILGIQCVARLQAECFRL